MREVYADTMAHRADTLVFVRRRLMSLHHAGEGVLASERAAFDWDWLERAVAERAALPTDPIAWGVPMPSGRAAILRACAAPDLPHGASWGVVGLLLEAPAHAWFLQRAVEALTDDAWWSELVAHSTGSVALPDWRPDAPVEVSTSERDRLLRGESVRAPWLAAGAGVQAVLGPVRALGTVGALRVRWSLGLPVAAPGSQICSIRASGATTETPAGRGRPRVEPVPRAPAASASRTVEVSHVPAPAAAPVTVSEPFEVRRRHGGRFDWLPWICLAVMAGALAMGWRLLAT